MTNDDEYLSIWWFDHITSLAKNLVKFLKLHYFLFLEFEGFFFLHILGKSFIWYVFCKHCPLVWGLSFCFLNSVFLRIVFHFGEVQFIIFSFMCCVFDVVFKKYLSNSRSPKFSDLFSSGSIIILQLGLSPTLSLFFYMAWSRD